MDYAGPVDGKMILVIIDAHSKWVEAICTHGSTSAVVIEELGAQFGIPETVVTANGTCFVSAEFGNFLSRNGVKHITSAPYHPASNGLAERVVQVVKQGLRKNTRGSMKSRLAHLLFQYRITPQTIAGVSPSELLLGRRPRSRLDLLKPHTAEQVEKKQSAQKEQHDGRSRERKLDVVFVRNYHQGARWLPGIIEQKTGPVSFLVKLQDGRIRRCHQDQLRCRSVSVPLLQESTTESDTDIVAAELCESSSSYIEPSPNTQELTIEGGETNQPTDTTVEPVATEELAKAYPRRVRHPVDRYEPGW